MLQASAELFPHLDVTVAYVLLFGVYSGIVPDGIDDLLVEDIDWAGDATVLLSYVKGRTAAESLTLPRPAVRLLERWLEHSSLLRGSCPRRSAGSCGWASPAAVTPLWPRVRCTATSSGHGLPDTVSSARTATRCGCTGTGSAPRTSPCGTAAAGGAAGGDDRPQPQPPGGGRPLPDRDHSGPAAGRRGGHRGRPARHDPPGAATSGHHRRGHRGASPGLPAAGRCAGAGRHGGRRAGRRSAGRVPAACADQLSGLHGPKGKPCPARPWVCLLCPLAVFAPGTRQPARAEAFFSRQWRQLPAAQFMAVFGPTPTGSGRSWTATTPPC